MEKEQNHPWPHWGSSLMGKTRPKSWTKPAALAQLLNPSFEPFSLGFWDVTLSSVPPTPSSWPRHDWCAHSRGDQVRPQGFMCQLQAGDSQMQFPSQAPTDLQNVTPSCLFHVSTANKIQQNPSIFSSQTFSSCSIPHPAEGSTLHPNAQAEVSSCFSLSHPLPNQQLEGTGSTFSLILSPPLPPTTK